MADAVLRCFSVAALVLVVCGCNSAPPRVHVISVYEPQDRRPVKVTVRDTKGPVVLALSSGESTTWVIEIRENAKLKEVILQGGRSASRVLGVPSDVPIWSEIFGAASEVGDYGYRLATHYVRERYRVEPASFQIKYSGREFEIR